MAEEVEGGLFMCEKQIRHKMVLFIVMNLANSGVIQKVVAKEWATEIFGKIRPLPILWEPFKVCQRHLVHSLAVWNAMATAHTAASFSHHARIGKGGMNKLVSNGTVNFLLKNGVFMYRKTRNECSASLEIAPRTSHRCKNFFCP